MRRGVRRRSAGAAGVAAGSVGLVGSCCGAGFASTGSVLTVLMMLRWLARSACSDAGHAAAAPRGVGRRDRGVDVGQDRLNMTERGAGILPCIDLGQQAVLQGGEIVGVGCDAAKSLVASRRRSARPLTGDRMASLKVVPRSRRPGAVEEPRAWLVGCVSSDSVTAGGDSGATGVLVALSAGGSRSTSRRYSLSAEPAIFRPLLFSQVHDVWAQSSAREQDVRTVKDRLASWRHSADTATIERRSKVIDGQIHDARRAEKRRMKPRAKEGNRSRCRRPLRKSASAVPLVPEFYAAACTRDRRQRGLCHRSTRERT